MSFYRSVAGLIRNSLRYYFAPRKQIWRHPSTCRSFELYDALGLAYISMRIQHTIILNPQKYEFVKIVFPLIIALVPNGGVGSWDHLVVRTFIRDVQYEVQSTRDIATIPKLKTIEVGLLHIFPHKYENNDSFFKNIWFLSISENDVQIPEGQKNSCGK